MAPWINRYTGCLALLALFPALSCTEDPRPPNLGTSGTGPSGFPGGPSGGGDSGSESGTGDTDTGSSTDETGGAACDPLSAALDCGDAEVCDPETLTCVPATDDQGLDAACELDSDCAPGLACAEGRCLELCDPGLAEAQACAQDRQCTEAPLPYPGLCREPCNLLLDDCPLTDEACKRGVGPDDATVAVCVPNFGAGVEGDACVADGDCFPGFLCTPDAFHTLPCLDDAAACCTPICHTIDLPCYGLEPSCYPLSIPGQESAGFCGVA